MLAEGNLFALSAVHEQLRERDARHNAGALPTCPVRIFLSKHDFLELPEQLQLKKFMEINAGAPFQSPPEILNLYSGVIVINNAI